jgi:hypothetical protein
MKIRRANKIKRIYKTSYIYGSLMYTRLDHYNTGLYFLGVALFLFWSVGFYVNTRGSKWNKRRSTF